MGATTDRVQLGEDNQVECIIRQSRHHDRVVTTIRSGRSFEFGVSKGVATPLDACPDWAERVLLSIGVVSVER